MLTVSGWIRRLDRVVGWLSGFAATIACVAIVAMTVGITVNALSRYLLNRPILFIDEYAQYLLVVTFYFGVGYTFRAGRHVTVDLLVDRLSEAARRPLRIVISAAGLWAIGLMCLHAWGAWLSTARSGLVSLTPLETPLSLPYLSVAIGMSLFVLEIAVDLLKGLSGIDDAARPTVPPHLHEAGAA